MLSVLVEQAHRGVKHLVANAGMAKKVLVEAIPRIPTEPNWPEHRVLDFALVTDRKFWPEATVKRLEIILKRFL